MDSSLLTPIYLITADSIRGRGFRAILAGCFVCYLCFSFSMNGFGEVKGFVRDSTHITQVQSLNEEDFTYLATGEKSLFY